MRVAYVGHFDRDWTTETHMAVDLAQLGVDVHRVQEPRAWDTQFIRRLERIASDADLLLVTRTHPIGAVYERLWRRLEARGVLTAGIHLDLQVGLPRGAHIEHDAYYRTGMVFTADGDPRSQAVFERLGIRHRWSPAAVCSTEATPGTARPSMYPPVVFVGQPADQYPHEWPWRAQLLWSLHGELGRDFAGLPHHASRPIRGRELNDLYASTTVVVGDSLAPMWPDGRRHGWYWSDRVYETVGRGGFLLFPRIDGIEDHFTDGEHLRLYDIGDTAGVHELVRYYLAHPDEAAAIAAAGQAHVRAHHTYQHRMRAVLDALGLTIDTAEPVTAPIRLELGSGYDPAPGFVHLDLNPDAPDVDIVGPAWPLDLPDASVAELRAVDVLEHISYWDTDAALADWSRVLVPGGRLYVQVPDAHEIMRRYVAGEASQLRTPEGLPSTALAGAAWRLLGGHHDGRYVKGDDDWRWNAHYSLWSYATLVAALQRAGLDVESITTNAHPNLLCWAVKP